MTPANEDDGGASLQPDPAAQRSCVVMVCMGAAIWIAAGAAVWWAW